MTITTTTTTTLEPSSAVKWATGRQQLAATTWVEADTRQPATLTSVICRVCAIITTWVSSISPWCPLHTHWTHILSLSVLFCRHLIKPTKWAYAEQHWSGTLMQRLQSANVVLIFFLPHSPPPPLPFSPSQEQLLPLHTHIHSSLLLLLFSKCKLLHIF